MIDDKSYLIAIGRNESLIILTANLHPSGFGNYRSDEDIPFVCSAANQVYQMFGTTMIFAGCFVIGFECQRTIAWHHVELVGFIFAGNDFFIVLVPGEVQFFIDWSLGSDCRVAMMSYQLLAVSLSESIRICGHRSIFSRLLVVHDGLTFIMSLTASSSWLFSRLIEAHSLRPIAITQVLRFILFAWLGVLWFFLMLFDMISLLSRYFNSGKFRCIIFSIFWLFVVLLTLLVVFVFELGWIGLFMVRIVEWIDKILADFLIFVDKDFTAELDRLIETHQDGAGILNAKFYGGFKSFRLTGAWPTSEKKERKCFHLMLTMQWQKDGTSEG